MKKLIFLFLIICQAVHAQVQFEAKVSKTTLGLNERLRIDFTMNDDGDNFVPPSFEGFKVVGGPSQMVSQSYINGRMSFNKTYTYFLLPVQKGTLTIKQASIEIRKQIYKTTPIRVTVTNAVEMPKDPNDTSISADDAIQLVADVSKTNPYINEPITVVYKLYISYNIGLSNFKELDKPKYNDFWSQNIEIKQLNAEDAIYNGERMRCVVLKKMVLYPQKSGKLTIEPLSLDLDIQIPTNRRGYWGTVLKEASKRVSAGARTINVKPLPEAGKPEDFTGAVGRFDFKVVPSKTELSNGESLELNISVSGNGNLKLFNLPKPVVPAALEMYDPVHKEQVTTPLSGMTGKISDNYTIIPQFKGDYVIKPMTFAYYDLGSGKYKTITSKEIKIRVLDGPSPSEGSVASGGETPNKRKISKAEHFEFIKLKTNLEPMHRDDFLGSGLFYGLLAAPFLCIPLLVGVRRKKQAMDSDVAGNKSKMSNRLAKKFLSEAKKHIGSKEPFYIALEKAMHNFLKAKTHIETSEMSKDKIREILLARNANPQTVDDFITLTENCEFARYAPSSSVTIHNDYDKAVEIISALEKQI